MVRIWEEGVMTTFKVTFQQSPGDNNENHEKYHLRQKEASVTAIGLPTW
jgi:hypothetical protein